ncbi:MAG: TauD/TfdA family dioxygenase [Balneolales bacterium]|nr:TauD/TfdA family dioxygenase [Balneolales bacterium]
MLKKNPFQKLKNVQAVSISDETPLVEFSYLDGYTGQGPVVATPASKEVVLNDWITANRPLIAGKLNKYGGILFRGFAVDSVPEFEDVVKTFGDDLLDYKERSSPRHKVEGKVYTSTDHPKDQRIHFHNELAYSKNWPLEIFFYCDTQPGKGGETPIADSRKVYENLNPDLREKFETHGVLYQRYLGSGLGLSWQEVFQTDDREEAESYCKDAGIELEWIDDKRVISRSKRPAVQVHPETGEKLWFNHAHFFNVWNMHEEERKQLISMVKEEEIPFNTYVGDHTPISREEVHEIMEAFDKASVEFPWQKGDILYLDNMLMAHSRNPFEGERRIVVAMNKTNHSLQATA